ncbi:cytochrome P450 2D18 [Clathrospora elynae]|uniref:Cytochrome P450 2D18 n=1 Tax=Clathrospora elynae TaxID=706981 RepID=A0A6A5SIM7_9PLEO|nr:cytochrome P450 2D18 [Clathrospora elynae]
MAAITLAVAAGILLGLVYLLRVGHREASLPPGPLTKPIVGNLLNVPTTNAHIQFTEWAQQYGGIYSLKLANATAIVLSDRRLIREFIDKKGAIYGSRPDMYVPTRYVARDPANIPLVIFLPYGDKLRLCRKLIMQHFSEGRVEQQYMPLVEAEASQMLFDFWKEPTDLMLHPVRLTNSVVRSLVYNVRTRRAEELRKYTEMFEKYVKLLEPGGIPPVDLLPWLVYVPQCLWTGSWKNWKSKCDEPGKAVNSVFTKLAEPVLERRKHGINLGTFYDFLLDQKEKGVDLTRRDLDIFAGSMVDAGSDTTAAAIRVFIQAMAKYPHIQHRAHKQVDECVGHARSPRWADSSKLPYVTQIVKETLRWRPAAPLMPHATTTDDTINGYYIPKNSTIIINIWGLNNSPADLDSCDTSMSEFNPDRYAKRIKSPSHYAASSDFASRDHYTYGSGRRLCPGIHLAERTLFVAMAKLLWAFEFKETPGAPVDVDPQTGYTEGLIRTPKPFKCEILVRSGREGVIERELANAREVLEKFEI